MALYSRGLHFAAEPERFSSPPPKPPRRRHSDQSSKPSGPCAANRRKHFNGSLSASTKIATEDIGTSGSESLPASLMLVCNNQENEGTRLSKKFHSQSASRLSQYFCNASLSTDGNHHVQVSNSSQKNSKENIYSFCASSSLRCHAELDKTYGSFTSTANRSLDVPARVLKNENSVKLSKSIFFDNNYIEAKADKELNILLRRHHSDPFLSTSDIHFQPASSVQFHKELVGNAPYHSSEIFSCSSESKYICLVSDDLKVLKETNDMLWKHLCFLQAKLDGNHSIPKKETDAPSFSDLLADIYSAQKQKDIVFQNRLQLVEEERDTAVKELEELLQSITKSFEDGDCSEGVDDISDQELKQLVREIEITDNPVRLLQHQRCLLGLLYQAKEVKLHRLSCELKLALVEKKQALEKVENLEQQLIKWRSSCCFLHSETRQWEASLLDALCQVITQRDSALSRVQCLQEQIQSFQFHHSSCQLQTPSSSDIHNSNYDVLSNFDEVMNSRDMSSLGEMQDDSNTETKTINCSDTFDDVRSLKCQISYLMKQLNHERKCRHASEEQCQKLGHLVVVLHKKLNGLNSSVPV